MDLEFDSFELSASAINKLSNVPRRKRLGLIRYLWTVDCMVSMLLEGEKDEERKNLAEKKTGQVIATAAEHFGVSQHTLLEKNRSIASYRRRKMLAGWLFFYGGLPYEMIAKTFMWGDHTTFLRAVQQFGKDIARDGDFKQDFLMLAKAIGEKTQIKKPLYPIP